ncbi:vWA-MoxR associated conflict system protein [Streptomyces bacillaris]|uniref:vWA-MoxR associated conflict system protein n=1 Tax=Streptomyces bacillaris TaxID=68179 RepID=UPI0036FA45C9
MSSGPGGRRHVVVVAPHCASMEHLERLEEAATDLYAVLTDPSLGSCEPGMSDGGALIMGHGLESRSVVDRLEEAIGHAAEHGATLVLGFLGHGFAPGRTSELHLMCAESGEDLRHGAVNVGEMLARAADHPGVDGVIGIIDTCHAGGAPPAMDALTGGARSGRTRLSLLMASSVGQAARDLVFSRQLAALVRAGLPRTGTHLSTTDVRDALRAVVVGQNVTCFEYDGDGLADGPLWVARNAAVVKARGGSLSGTLATEELTRALTALDPAAPVPDGAPDLGEALHCRTAVLRHPPGPARERALRAVDGLITAVTTVAFIREWIGTGLTTARLRQAHHTLSAAAGRPPGACAPTDVAIVDELTFNHPVSENDGRRGLAQFVALLAQICGKSSDDPALRSWAVRIQALVEVNDAVEATARRASRSRLTLVIGLHASLTGDWPETVDGWLLLDGSVIHHQEFRSDPADRRGTEAAIEDAVLWAEDHAGTLALPLTRVDVAAPGKLLLDWHPEEAGAAMLLGVRYDVRLHWSSRLAPDASVRSIEAMVAARWESLSGETGETPVDWLGPGDVADPQALRGRLRNGSYARGIGLLHHPGTDAHLLDTLLAYTPVLFWPQPHAPAGFPAERHAFLDDSWWAMPGALVDAYRKRWQGGAGADLADLRAVWDDEEWLRFCRLFRTPPSSARPAPPASPALPAPPVRSEGSP